MKRAVCLFASALLASAVPWAYSQAGNLADLQQKLNSSFKITTTAANHSDIAAAGDVVEVHKDGLRMSALSTVLTESNTYKDGKLGGGAAKRAWGSFGTAMLQGMAAASDPSGMMAVPTGPPPHILAAGDRCWILSITVQKDGVVFKLLTDPDDSGLRYHADLKFPFTNKKQMPSADEILATIAEVLTVAPQEQPAQEQGGQQAVNPAQDVQQATVSGKYLMEKGGAELDIVSDTGCTMLLPGGQQYKSLYQLNGDTLMIRCNPSGDFVSFKVQGDRLVFGNGQVWVHEGSAPQRQYDELAPPPAPPATPPNR
jgi:hypothetical protein